MSDRSMDKLLEFLDWTAEKGLMAKNTVAGRKAAVSNVLGVLDPEERGDVTNIDLDSVMTRFINLHRNKYNTSSLNVYKSRTNAAINDFRKWLEDPLSFKPQSNKAEKKGQPKAAKPQKSPSAKYERHHDPYFVQSTPTASSPVNVFPIPIRENVVVRVHGLPFDLTPAEAKKIAAVIQAMALAE